MFGAGVGLRVRMYAALALNGVLLVALLAGLIALFFVDDGWSLVAFIVVFALIGAFGERRRNERRRPSKQMDLERASRAVARLSVLADIPEPAVTGERRGPPLSWTTALPRRRPNIHVTRALLLQLDDAQLEAVLAHELSHIANRDAVIMTVLSAPGIYVLRGLRLSWHEAGLRGKAGLLMFGFMLIVPAAISAGLARIVSRHRELAADRGAAMLTGSPSALTAALLRVSAEIASIPTRDLRKVAARDLLHVVPVRPERGVRRLWATHPRLTTRVRELERLEERLQARG